MRHIFFIVFVSRLIAMGRLCVGCSFFTKTFGLLPLIVSLTKARTTFHNLVLVNNNWFKGHRAPALFVSLKYLQTMTVKELKMELNKYPDNMEVFMDERRTDEYQYGLLNSVRKQQVEFYADEESEPAIIDCVVLDEQ